MKLILPATLALAAASNANAYCWSCDNAPSRSWSWWFGFGDCNCESNKWGGSCCNQWSENDWDVKWDEWRRGDSCEAQPGQACSQHLESTTPLAPVETQDWKYEPSGETDQLQCEADGCMWVECFQQTSVNLATSISADEMCSQCGGPWEGKCDWHSYAPGALAFAGPGKHCGFRYPACPSQSGKNCFCGSDAISELREGWCSGGQGQDTFCPANHDHGDGRTQECEWRGWTISPQENGGIEETCAAWGTTEARAAPPVENPVEMASFVQAEPSTTVKGTQLSAAGALLMGAGAYGMKKRKLRQRPAEMVEAEMTRSDAV